MGEILLYEHIEDCIDEFDVGLICSSSSQVVVGNPLHKLSYSATSARYVKPMRYREDVNAVKLNCTDKFVAFASNSLSIFDLEREISIRQLHDHDGVVTDVTWHHSSPYQLASVSRADGTLRTWDVRSHPAQVSVRRAQRPFSRVEYSPDCSFIACSGEAIAIFDLNSAQSVVNISCGSYITDIAFNPAECLLASTSEDRIVRFWDVDTGECVTQSVPFESVVHDMEFHPDGKYLICASSQQLSAIVWEPFDMIAQLPKIPMFAIGALTPNKPKFWRTLDLCIRDDRLLHLSVPSNSFLKCYGCNLSGSLLTDNISAEPESASTNVACLISLPLTELEQCVPKLAHAVMGCGISQSSVYPSPKLPPADGFIPSPRVGGSNGTSSNPQLASALPTPIVPPIIKRPSQIAVTSCLKQQRDRDSPNSPTTACVRFNPTRPVTQTPTSPLVTDDPFAPTHELPREPLPRPLSGAPLLLDEVDSRAGSASSGTGVNEDESSASGGGRTSVASFASSTGTNGDDLPGSRRSLAQQSAQLGMPHAIASRSSSNFATPTEHRGTADVVKTKAASIRQRRPSSPSCATSPLNLASSSPSKNQQTFAQNHSNNNVNNTSASPAKSSLKQQLRSKSCSTNTKNLDSIDSANVAAQKSPAKVLGRRMSSTSTTADQKSTTSELSKMDDLLRGSQKVHAIAKRRATELELFLAHVTATNSTNFSEEIVDFAAKQEDLRIFASLLKIYLEHPKTYSLGLNIKFLEKVRALFAHQNSAYVILALDLLEMIVHAFGDSIRHGLAAKCYSLGVDVAAEQRFEKCSRCRNVLLELRLNAPFLVERLDDAHKPTFNNILSQIDRITAE